MNKTLDKLLGELEDAVGGALDGARHWDREAIVQHSDQATSAARNILEVDIPESRNPGEEVSVVREMMVEARDLFFEIGGRELLEGTEKVDAGLYAEWVHASQIVEQAFRVVDTVSRWEPHP